MLETTTLKTWVTWLKEYLGNKFSSLGTLAAKSTHTFSVKTYFFLQGGPLPIISLLTTTIRRFTTPLTHVLRPFYRGYNYTLITYNRPNRSWVFLCAKVTHLAWLTPAMVKRVFFSREKPPNDAPIPSSGCWVCRFCWVPNQHIL